VRLEDIADKMVITADPERCIAMIRHYVRMGFDRIILHNVNRQQELFIKDFGEKVLPFIR
jgi:coenzyme F420-dependent glucose-6-phosphate dehydrogenase